MRTAEERRALLSMWLPRVLGAVFALCAVGGCLQSLWLLHALPRTEGLTGPRVVLAAPIVLLGAAWPVLLARSPSEPSLFKLVVLAGLLSPPAYALAWCLACVVVGAGLADPVVLCIAAALQLCGVRRRRIGLQPLGAAAWIALGTVALAALAVALALAVQDTASLLARPGMVWHSGIVEALERRFPPENPWLASTPVPCNWASDAILAAIARSLGLFPAHAAIVAAALAALAVGACLYLVGAPLWQEPRRALLVPLCAWLGPHALAGVGLAARSGPRSTLSADAAVESGLSAFLELGPSTLALALSLGLWTCAAHAIRHGRAPWVGTCAAFAAATVTIDPLLGIASVLPVAIAAAVARGERGARDRLLVALCLVLLPALGFSALAGWKHEPLPRNAGVVESAFALDGLLLLLLCAVPLLLPRKSPAAVEVDARGRRAIALLLWLAIGVALALPWTSELAARRQVDLVRLAALAAAPLAAGGIVDLWSGRPAARGLAVLLFAVLAGGGGRRVAQSLRDAAISTRESMPFVIEEGRLVEADGDRPKADRWLRAWPDSPPDPVLVRSVWRPVDHLDRNRVPHLAPLLTGRSLWCDRDPDHAGPTERWKTRHDDLERLFGESLIGEPETSWDPRMFEELDRRYRVLLILVEEDDRRSSRMQIDRRLPLLGAQVLHQEGSVAIWRRSPRGGESR